MKKNMKDRIKNIIILIIIIILYKNIITRNITLNI